LAAARAAARAARAVATVEAREEAVRAAVKVVVTTVVEMVAVGKGGAAREGVRAEEAREAAGAGVVMAEV
jgi:hypothetical protein